MTSETPDTTPTGAQPEQPADSHTAPTGQQQYYQQPTGQQSYYQQPTGQQYYQQSGGQQPYVATKDHVVAGLLAIFLGGFGIHKFYLGYNTAGFIMLGVTILGSLVSFGISGAVIWVIGLVEGIIYLTKNQSEFDRMYVYSQKDWF